MGRFVVTCVFVVYTLLRDGIWRVLVLDVVYFEHHSFVYCLLSEDLETPSGS